MKSIRADSYGCCAPDEPGHEGGTFPAQPGVPMPDMRIWKSLAVAMTPLVMLSAIAAVAFYFFK